MLGVGQITDGMSHVKLNSQVDARRLKVEVSVLKENIGRKINQITEDFLKKNPTSLTLLESYTEEFKALAIQLNGITPLTELFHMVNNFHNSMIRDKNFFRYGPRYRQIQENTFAKMCAAAGLEIGAEYNQYGTCMRETP